MQFLGVALLVQNQNSLFVARVTSFDAMRDTNKLLARQKSCDYHYYQYTSPIRTNLFHKERLFNMKSCCGLQIPFTAHTLPFGPRKERFREASLSFGRV